MNNQMNQIFVAAVLSRSESYINGKGDTKLVLHSHSLGQGRLYSMVGYHKFLAALIKNPWCFQQILFFLPYNSTHVNPHYKIMTLNIHYILL